MMEVEEEGPRMTIHVAAARAAVGREGEGEARCGVVLREVVVGMGDDVFRELLEHLHVL